MLSRKHPIFVPARIALSLLRAMKPKDDMGSLRSGPSAAQTNEYQLPYIVEMELPRDGFDHRLRRNMEEFHRSHDIRARFGRRQRRKDGEFCRWCFAEASQADLFQARFGGTRLAIDDVSIGQSVAK